MPDKAGRLTPMERIFAERYAATGDAVYAAEKAGYSSPQQRASQNLGNQALMSESRAMAEARMVNEALPLAVESLIKTLKDPVAPWGVKNNAAKIVLDHTKRADDKADKEPHEMTASEIDARIAELHQVAASRAKPVLELQAEPAPSSPESGVFG